MIVERDWFAAEAPGWIASLRDLPPPQLSAGRATAVAIDSAALDGPLDERGIARSTH